MLRSGSGFLSSDFADERLEVGIDAIKYASRNGIEGNALDRQDPQRFDGFVAEKDERGDRAKPAGERLVAAGVADAANDVLTA